MDLHVIPFENVYHFSYPNVALSHWIDLFLDVINSFVTVYLLTITTLES